MSRRNVLCVTLALLMLACGEGIPHYCDAYYQKENAGIISRMERCLVMDRCTYDTRNLYYYDKAKRELEVCRKWAR